MKRVLRYIEQYCPSFISLSITMILIKYKINFIENESFNSALDSVLSMTGLIIGFLGAVMPVVMSMKNESKFVIYVFQKDHHKLFLKYIKRTVEIGLISAAATIIMYFKDDFPEKVKFYSFYFWIYLMILFLLATYRSIKYMLELIFSNDQDIIKGKTIDTDMSQKQKDIMKKLNKEL